MSVNNGILLKGVLILNLLNNPLGSCFLINLDFSLLHVGHSDKCTILLLLVFKTFEFMLFVSISLCFLNFYIFLWNTLDSFLYFLSIIDLISWTCFSNKVKFLFLSISCSLVLNRSSSLFVLYIFCFTFSSSLCLFKKWSCIFLYIFSLNSDDL